MKKSILIVAALAALSVSSVKAETLHYVNSGAGQNVNIITPYSTGKTVFTGLMNVQVPDAPSGMPTAFQALCVDLKNTVSQGDTYPVDLIPLPDAGLHGLLNSGRAAYLYSTYAAASLSNTEASGLQLAVWDILYDGGDGLNVGSFQATNASSGAQTHFNAYLVDSLGKSGTATWLRATTHPNNTRQDLIGPAFNGNVIPEPSAIALLAAGGLPMLTVLRRRSR